MKENFKRRLAIFLSIALIMPAIVTMLPNNTLVAEAATKVEMYLPSQVKQSGEMIV